MIAKVAAWTLCLVCITAAENVAQRERLEACSDSSVLLQFDVHVEASAALDRNDEIFGLDHLQNRAGTRGNVTGPKGVMYVVVWVVPLVLMAGAWIFPWMYERGTKSAAQPPTVEGLQQAAAKPADAKPIRGIADLVWRIGPLWVTCILGSLSTISGPTGAYIGVNFFAQRYTSLPHRQIHCENSPEVVHCRRGVMDLSQIQMCLGFAVPIMQILLGPALGCLSDAYGRRPVIVSVAILRFIPILCVALHLYCGTSLWLSYWLQPLTDLPSGAVSYAYIIDRVQDPSSLALAFGLMAAVENVFGLVAMLTGSRLTLVSAFTAGFIIQIVSLAYCVLILPESLRAEDRKPMKPRFLLPGFALDILARNELLARLTYCAMISSFLDTGFKDLIRSWLQLYLSWSMQAAYTCSILGHISKIVWMTLGIGTLVRYSGEAGVLNASRWFALIMGSAIVMSTQVWHIYLIQAILKGGVAMVLPCIAAIKGRLIPATEQGHLQGCLNTVTSVSASFGPLAFGIIFRATGNVEGIRTKESNTMMYYEILMMVPCILVLFTFPRLMRKYVPSDDKPVEKSAKSIQ